MNEENKVIHKIFDMNISENNLYKLEYCDNNFLLPSLVLDKEDLIMNFDVSGLTNFKNLSNISKQDKLRFLINASSLEDKIEYFEFSLDPADLYVDINLIPKILFRDIALVQPQNSFSTKYKALIGCLLFDKYSYTNYLETGQTFFKKKKVLSPLLTLNTVPEIKDWLIKKYNEERTLNTEKKVQVNKSRYAFLNRFQYVGLVVILLLSVFSGYLFFYEMPFKNTIIESNNYFSRQDYSMAINSLANLEIEKMPPETKYQLARAYIISESLTQEQKENILKHINIKTSSSLLDFWIYVGRLNYDAAIDIAKRIGDEDLLLYALMKKQISVKNNTTLSGDEKTELLNNINKQIEDIKSKRELENKELEETLVSGETTKIDEATPDITDETSMTDIVKFSYVSSGT